MKPQEIWQLYCGEQPVIDIGCGWHCIFDFEYVKFDQATHILGQPTCVNHHGDFHDMSDFSDETFAFINANNIIEHAEFPERALREWIRIMKVGGVMHLCWPHMDVQERETLIKMRDAVNRNDMKAYHDLGGNDNWISTGKNGIKILDVHWHKTSLDEMKLMLPKNLIILAEYPGCTLILKKVS